MCNSDSTGPDAWSETWRRARKSHRCDACRETIRKADLYHYCSGVWDGYAKSYKHCARCWETFELLNAEMRTYDAAPALLLDCGQIYEGDDPRMLELAFMTPDEGQLLAQENTRLDKALTDMRSEALKRPPRDVTPEERERVKEEFFNKWPRLKEMITEFRRIQEQRPKTP